MTVTDHSVREMERSPAVKQRRWLAGCTVIAAVTVAVAFWPPSQIVRTPGRSAVERRSPPAMGLDQVPLLPSVPGHPRSELSTSAPPSLSPFVVMARERAAATNLRLFVHLAKQHPQDGGAFHAHVVLADCANLLQAKTPRYAPDTPARRVAIERIAARVEACASFTLNELQSADADFAASQDPLAAVAKAVASGDAEERRVAAEKVIAMRDPTLIATVPILMRVDETMYFDGKPYGGLDQQTYMKALTLLPCSFGQTCDATDDNVTEACARTGICPGSVAEMMRGSLGRSAEKYHAFREVYAGLVTAIAAGNLAAFAQPTGSVPKRSGGQ